MAAVYSAKSPVDYASTELIELAQHGLQVGSRGAPNLISLKPEQERTLPTAVLSSQNDPKRT